MIKTVYSPGRATRMPRGFKVQGVEGLEKTIFTAPYDNSDHKLDGTWMSLGIAGERIGIINEVLVRQDAFLPSVQEAAAYFLESEGANLTDQRMVLTRTAAVHYVQDGEVRVAFYDGTDGTNPIMRLESETDPRKNYEQGGYIVFNSAGDKYFRFFLSRTDPLIERLIERAKDEKREMPLPKSAVQHKPYTEFRQGFGSQFSRNGLVRATMGAYAEPYSKEMARRRNKEIDKEIREWEMKHGKALTEKEEKALRKDRQKHGTKNIDYRGIEAIRNNIGTSAFRQNAVLVMPTILWPARWRWTDRIGGEHEEVLGGIDITGYNAGYFGGLDWVRKGNNNRDIIYGVINPTEFEPAEPLEDRRTKERREIMNTQGQPTFTRKGSMTEEELLQQQYKDMDELEK